MESKVPLINFMYILLFWMFSMQALYGFNKYGVLNHSNMGRVQKAHNFENISRCIYVEFNNQFLNVKVLVPSAIFHLCRFISNSP